MRRTFFFAGAMLLFNLTLAALVLSPLAAWSGAQELLPTRMTWRLALLAVVFAPIYEELLLRAGLRRADYTLFFGPPLILFGATRGDTWNQVAAGVGVVALLTYGLRRRWLLRHGPARIASARRFVRHYPLVFWTYAIAFALLHLGNYRLEGARTWLLLPMVVPQFLVGSIAGYLRLRDGLRSSWLLHLLNNAMAVGLWTWLP